MREMREREREGDTKFSLFLSVNTFFQMTINTVFTLFKVEFLLHIKFCTLLKKRQPENRTSPNSEQVFTLSRVKHFLGSLRKNAEDPRLFAEVYFLCIISLHDLGRVRKGVIRCITI